MISERTHMRLDLARRLRDEDPVKQVNYSPYALARGYIQRRGTIVGESRCKTCWYIVWEGYSPFYRTITNKTLVVPC